MGECYEQQQDHPFDSDNLVGFPIGRWIQDVMPVDSREQVRRQHTMFERLIAKGGER